MKNIKFSKKQIFWFVLIIVLIISVSAVIFLLPPSKTNPPDKEQSSNNSSDYTEDTEYDAVKPPTTDLPATVVINAEKNPSNGESAGIKFPYKIEGYNLTIEKLAPYDGLYVEDGTNSQIKNVAMLLIRNDGDFPVEYTKINIEYENESLLFEVSALPVGESAVVQEKNKKSIPDGVTKSGTALVVQRANMEMSKDMVSVEDNGDNSITITNLTNKTIPTVRIFYKYYMKDENVYVGGIAFTSRITRLAANSKIVIRPSHYTSDSTKVVMVSTYESK